MNWKIWCLVALLAFAAVQRVHSDDDGAEDDDYAGEERAHLVIRKYFKNEVAVQGRNLTVHIQIHNGGNSAAKDVEVRDGDLPEGFTLTEGSLTASFRKIDVAESASHSYVITAVKGEEEYHFPAAIVTYAAEPESSDQQAARSSRPWVYVMTPMEQIKKYAIQGGTYLSLGICRTPQHWLNAGIIAAVLGALLGGNAVVKSAGAARKTTQRKKALAELEKEY